MGERKERPHNVHQTCTKSVTILWTDSTSSCAHWIKPIFPIIKDTWSINWGKAFVTCHAAMVQGQAAPVIFRAQWELFPRDNPLPAFFPEWSSMVHPTLNRLTKLQQLLFPLSCHASRALYSLQFLMRASLGWQGSLPSLLSKWNLMLLSWWAWILG